MKIMKVSSKFLNQVVSQGYQGDINQLHIIDINEATGAEYKEQEEEDEDQLIYDTEAKRHKLMTMYIKDKEVFEELGIKSIKEIRKMGPEEVENTNEIVELKIFSHAHTTILQKSHEVFWHYGSKMFGWDVDYKELLKDETFSKSVVYSPIGNWMFRIPSVVKTYLLQLLSVWKHSRKNNESK